MFLLPVYPAREQPIPGVTSEMIAAKMTKGKARVVDKKNVPGMLGKEKIELLITAGAGDIDTLVEPIRQLLEK